MNKVLLDKHLQNRRMKLTLNARFSDLRGLDPLTETVHAHIWQTGGFDTNQRISTTLANFLIDALELEPTR